LSLLSNSFPDPIISPLTTPPVMFRRISSGEDLLAFQVPSACNCISAQTVISTVPSSLRTTSAEVIFSSSTAEVIVPWPFAVDTGNHAASLDLRIDFGKNPSAKIPATQSRATPDDYLRCFFNLLTQDSFSLSKGVL